MINRKHKSWFACLLTLLCICSAAIRPIYTGDVDNYTMALTANHLFAGMEQDTYIGYLNPLLCVIFEGIHYVFPKADCFMLTAGLMLSAGVLFLGYALANIVRNRFALLGSYLVLFTVVFQGDLFHNNFTYWAAFLSGTGMFLLMLIFHQKLYGKKWVISSAVFLAFGTMWRYEACMVFLPYLFGDILLQSVFLKGSFAQKKQAAVWRLKCAAIPLACVLLLVIGHFAVRNMEYYQSATEYDAARSAFIDYPVYEWQEIKEKIPDISQNDYESIYSWVLLDTERIDTELFVKLQEAGGKTAYTISISNFAEMQKKVVSVFLDSSALQFLLCVAVGIFMIAMCSKMVWYDKLEILILCAGTNSIYLLFVYLGRAIERAYVAALYALIISMVVLYWSKVQEEKSIGYTQLFKSILTLFVCTELVTEVAAGKFVWNQSVFWANTKAENAYKAFCQEEEVYFWRVGQYVSEPLSSFMEQGKLPPYEFLSHHMFDGAWVYGQRYFKQYLEEVGVTNPMEALLFRENTYYVADDCSYVLTYLQEHYNENTKAIIVKQIDNIPVWKFWIE